MAARENHAGLWGLMTDEDGSLSVEFALWLPVIFIALMFVVDASAAFFAQANMWHVAGEISRALVTGQMSVAEAQAFIDTQTRFAMQIETVDQVLVVNLARPFSDIGTGVALSFVGDMRVQVFQHIVQEVRL